MQPKFSILTQNLFSQARKIKLRWFVLVLLVPLFGLLAAFGNASNDSPATVNNHVDIKTVVEDVTLPLPVTTVNHDEIFWQLDVVKPDDTLYTLFKRMNIRDEDAIKF